MKYLKIYEDHQTDEEIHRICERYNITNYTINPDKDIDVDGDVYLINENLKYIPLNFNYVSGHFNCGDNNLTSLKGSPKKVGGSFYCIYNNLTSLEGCPKEVGGGFYCSLNNLTSLRDCPEKINGYFDCSYNRLTSLKGCPKEVGGDFCCNNNKNLKDIKDFPKLKKNSRFFFNNTPFAIISIILHDDVYNFGEYIKEYDKIHKFGDDSIVLPLFNLLLLRCGIDKVDNVKGYTILKNKADVDKYLASKS